MPATTYPGTVTPLRGLSAFTEHERDVLFGRDTERDELAKLITGEGFRAGLLYGEPGVGKTSLLRAGLIPHLRDHGVIVLPCDDLSDPAASFARNAAEQTGLQPIDGEKPLKYLARIVSQALAGQLYLFILDDVDRIFGRDDREVIQQVGDLFARVVTRSGGRARFLFSCCSSRVHTFGVLERRTGSLFPPSSRFELTRFDGPTAAHVLERTIALAGLSADSTVAQAIAADLARTGAVLPADLQIATMAVGALGIDSIERLRAAGGARELERGWIAAAAESTGNERAALRLLAEIAAGDGTVPSAPDWAATQAGIDRGFALHALGALQHKGLVLEMRYADNPQPHYVLSHEILAQRIREVAAPARASARRAYELIGSKAGGGRLSLREWLEVRREGIEPATPDEAGVLQRTKRFFTIVAASVAAAPVVLIIFLYILMSGSYYLDVAPSADGRTERVVVRAGRSGLTAFDWLPSSPGFGDIVADTGVTRAMIAPDRWGAIADHDVTGDLDGAGYADQILDALTPDHRILVDYAATGDEVHLDAWTKGAPTADELVGRFEALRPIARGGSQEVGLVETGLAHDSPAVQTAAMRVAADTAGRLPGSYEDVLATALTNEDAEARHLAFAAVRGLGDERAAAVFQAALAANPGASARAELLAAVTTDTAGDAPSTASAVSILINPDVAESNQKRAAALLERGFSTAPAEASLAAVQLISDHNAPEKYRLAALELVSEHAPESTYGELVPALKLALKDKEPVRAAAWPLYARMAPKDAALELIGLGETELSTDMRVAVALSWGELARSKEPAAGEALLPFLDDAKPAVRAAAARAFGFSGRRSQNELIKMVKTERFDVAVGAAWGLANSAEVGASSSVAVGGIAQLWKRKGKARRHAVEIYARMAKKNPRSVYTYIAAAARGKDDESLKPMGVRGLCNAFATGNSSSGRALRTAASDSSTDVRRLVAECMVANVDGVDDDKSKGRAVARVASILVADTDPTIRSDAARVLAQLAQSGRGGADAGKDLVRLAGDDERAVRVLAVRGLAELGAKAPEGAAAALVKAFERRGVSQGEKLELLAAAREIGATDIIPLGLSDPSAPVRIATLEVAVATKNNTASAINGGLADASSAVRRAALDLIATGETGLTGPEVQSALAIASSDGDPTIAAFAMTTFASVAAPDVVKARLARELASPSERIRARAASAAVGLAATSPKVAIELLEPLLSDPARDVRAAMLPALATAYAGTMDPAQLAKMLTGSERHATRRIVAAAALVVADGGKGAARGALEKVQKSGPPLAAMLARVALGLIDGKADATEFLASLLR